MFRAEWRVNANAPWKEGTEKRPAWLEQTVMGSKEPRGAEGAGSRPHWGLEVMYGFN